MPCKGDNGVRCNAYCVLTIRELFTKNEKKMITLNTGIWNSDKVRIYKQQHGERLFECVCVCIEHCNAIAPHRRLNYPSKRLHAFEATLSNFFYNFNNMKKR